MGKAYRKQGEETNSTIQLGHFVLLLAIQLAYSVGVRLVTEMGFLHEFFDFQHYI